MKNKLLLHLIIDQYERSSKWKNEIIGTSSYRINEKDYKELGHQELIDQAIGLEEQGLIKIVWVKGLRKYDIEKVTYPLSNINRFCDIANRKPKYVMLEEQLNTANELQKHIKATWIQRYLEDVILRLQLGKVYEDNSKVKLQNLCLECLDQLNYPVFKRVFSKLCFGNSKIFEKELEDFVIRIAKKYNDEIDIAMENSEVLSQIYIEGYAQELSIKGSLRFQLEEAIIDTKDFTYGLVLNTQTLKNAVLLDNPQIIKVVTIENKANFVAQAYEEGTLFVFTHGFFTPTEKIFLTNLYCKLQNQKVSYLHSGDMDYGGVQIFRFIRSNIFPELKPFRMDMKTMKEYARYTEAISENSLERLRNLQEPLLQELIEYIVETGRVLEQESYL